MQKSETKQMKLEGSIYRASEELNQRGFRGAEIAQSKETWAEILDHVF
jgi:hypothetical protein